MAGNNLIDVGVSIAFTVPDIVEALAPFVVRRDIRLPLHIPFPLGARMLPAGIDR
jgi:hypothetical protein